MGISEIMEKLSDNPEAQKYLYMKAVYDPLSEQTYTLLQVIKVTIH
jgi:hypothetical protein